jgi:hypothetical protein
VVRRSFRSGSSWSRAEVHLAGGRGRRCRTRAVVLAKGAVRIPQASTRWLAARARRDDAAQGAAVATLASYAGLVVGAFGFVADEYARPPVAAALPVTPLPVEQQRAAR